MTEKKEVKDRYWMLRQTHGRNKLYETPELLMERCLDYFEWVESNPLQEAKLVSFQGDSTLESIPKMRAMTISALCSHLGMSVDTWDLYRKREDFIGVCAAVEQIIYNQKFEGASADMLNASIIARELGLMDKTQIDHKSTDGSMSPTKTVRELTDNELKEIIGS